jgi:CheY-like chemotaxis protein
MWAYNKNQERAMARNRVLVVDDEKNQREIYTLILEDDGYQVTAAQSGEQALRLARENTWPGWTA